jgi:hypothetical protein
LADANIFERRALLFVQVRLWFDLSALVTDKTGGGPFMAKTIIVPEATDLLPDPEVALRYNVSLRTLSRWDEQLELGFPRPVRINGRKYRRLAQLENWERARVA